MANVEPAALKKLSSGARNIALRRRGQQTQSIVLACGQQLVPMLAVPAEMSLQRCLFLETVKYRVTNAHRHAMDVGEGGVLTVKTIRDRGSVCILFSDTGPGLKEPHRVFDPFYTTKPVGKGTGLGLSICFGIVQEHGGRILCYNRQEGGAVFRVELPAVLAALPARDSQLTAAVPTVQK